MNTDSLRQKLEMEKQQLEAQLGSVGRRNQSVPNDWEQSPIEEERDSDVIDQADAFTNRQNEAAVLDALEARYDGVLAAITRIEAGTYGLCEECGAPIAPERLEANPSATTCAAHMR